MDVNQAFSAESLIKVIHDLQCRVKALEDKEPKREKLTKQEPFDEDSWCHGKNYW